MSRCSNVTSGACSASDASAAASADRKAFAFIVGREPVVCRLRGRAAEHAWRGPRGGGGAATAADRRWIASSMSSWRNSKSSRGGPRRRRDGCRPASRLGQRGHVRREPPQETRARRLRRCRPRPRAAARRSTGIAIGRRRGTTLSPTRCAGSTSVSSSAAAIAAISPSASGRPAGAMQPHGRATRGRAQRQPRHDEPVELPRSDPLDSSRRAASSSSATSGLPPDRSATRSSTDADGRSPSICWMSSPSSGRDIGPRDDPRRWARAASASAATSAARG